MWQLTRQQISNERLQLFHLLNKDIFYLFKSQLTNIEQPSWKNPTEEMTLSNFCYFSLAMVYPRRYNRMDLDLTTFLITYQRRKESEANWCHSVKPWSNGVASRRKLKTRGLLATPFGQGLRALALTCDDLRSLGSRSNLHASQGTFFTVWPPNPSQRKLSDVH